MAVSSDVTIEIDSRRCGRSYEVLKQMQIHLTLLRRTQMVYIQDYFADSIAVGLRLMVV